MTAPDSFPGCGREGLVARNSPSPGSANISGMRIPSSSPGSITDGSSTTGTGSFFSSLAVGAGAASGLSFLKAAHEASPKVTHSASAGAHFLNFTVSIRCVSSTDRLTGNRRMKAFYAIMRKTETKLASAADETLTSMHDRQGHLGF